MHQNTPNNGDIFFTRLLKGLSVKYSNGANKCLTDGNITRSCFYSQEFLQQTNFTYAKKSYFFYFTIL